MIQFSLDIIEVKGRIILLQLDSFMDDALKLPVGHGLAHRIHLGPLGYRFGQVVVRVSSGFHCGGCEFCCLYADRRLGNSEVPRLKLMCSLLPVPVGEGYSLVLAHGQRCRFPRPHENDPVDVVRRFVLSFLLLR